MAHYIETPRISPQNSPVMLTRPNGFEDATWACADRPEAGAAVDRPHRPAYIHGLSSPPHNKRSTTLPASPYERLMRVGAVESLQEKAATYVGFAAVADDEPIVIPENLQRDLGRFAREVLRLTRAYLALQELMDWIPDAEERHDDVG